MATIYEKAGEEEKYLPRELAKGDGCWCFLSPCPISAIVKYIVEGCGMRLKIETGCWIQRKLEAECG